MYDTSLEVFCYVSENLSKSLHVAKTVPAQLDRPPAQRSEDFIICISCSN